MASISLAGSEHQEKLESGGEGNAPPGAVRLIHTKRSAPSTCTSRTEFRSGLGASTCRVFPSTIEQTSYQRSHERRTRWCRVIYSQCGFARCSGSRGLPDVVLEGRRTGSGRPTHPRCAFPGVVSTPSGSVGSIVSVWFVGGRRCRFGARDGRPDRFFSSGAICFVKGTG